MGQSIIQLTAKRYGRKCNDSDPQQASEFGFQSKIRSTSRTATDESTTNQLVATES